MQLDAFAHLYLLNFSHIVFQLLRHDNLVNLIEVFRRKKRLYLVFEFVDHTLLDELEKYPNGLEEIMCRRILWQVLCGTEFCHLHNVRYFTLYYVFANMYFLLHIMSRYMLMSFLIH